MHMGRESVIIILFVDKVQITGSRKLALETITQVAKSWLTLLDITAGVMTLFHLTEFLFVHFFPSNRSLVFFVNLNKWGISHLFCFVQVIIRRGWCDFAQGPDYNHDSY